jgi:hypothetical protein
MKYNRNNSKKKYSHLKYQPINQKYYFFGGKIRTLPKNYICFFEKRKEPLTGHKVNFFF